MVIAHRPDEKREYFRMKIDAELTYNIPGKNRNFKGFCRNLSHTGIQFETTDTLKEGQSIEATLDTKHRSFRPLNATVNVVRIENLDDAQYLVTGKIVKFN